MSNEKLGTMLGDLNAILADMVRIISKDENGAYRLVLDKGISDQLKWDAKQAYKISNELYGAYVEHDQKK